MRRTTYSRRSYKASSAETLVKSATKIIETTRAAVADMDAAAKKFDAAMEEFERARVIFKDYGVGDTAETSNVEGIFWLPFAQFYRKSLMYTLFTNAEKLRKDANDILDGVEEFDKRI